MAHKGQIRTPRERPYTAPLESKSWDRLTGESAKWYARFISFRDLGPERTMNAAYRKHKGDGLTPAAHKVWYSESIRTDWRARTDKWDAFQRSVLEARRKADHDSAYNRHSYLARQVVDKAFDALERLDTRLLSPSDVLKLVELAVRLEREVLSEPLIADLERRMNEMVALR